MRPAKSVMMTSPRQVLRGTTYLVTRRCAQRRYLLRPSKLTSEIFAYLIALASRRYGVEVHAYCVMSNHYHLVVTDPEARLPAFQQFLDALVARAINALLGRWEHFWAPASFSAVTLGSPGDIVDKVAYVLANPVAARLVPVGRKWPGLWSAPAVIGTALHVQRPLHFFSKQGLLPESIDLMHAVPPGFASAQVFRLAVEAALVEREAAVAREGKVFLGVKRVLAQRPSAMPPPGEPRRELSPRVAAKDRWRRIELLGKLRDFLGSYREAMAGWPEKRETVVFPAGTYLMRVVHGAVCASG
jgi:putative transposase